MGGCDPTPPDRGPGQGPRSDRQARRARTRRRASDEALRTGFPLARLRGSGAARRLGVVAVRAAYRGVGGAKWRRRSAAARRRRSASARPSGLDPKTDSALMALCERVAKAARAAAVPSRESYRAALVNPPSRPACLAREWGERGNENLLRTIPAVRAGSSIASCERHRRDRDQHCGREPDHHQRGRESGARRLGGLRLGRGWAPIGVDGPF